MIFGLFLKTFISFGHKWPLVMFGFSKSRDTCVIFKVKISDGYPCSSIKMLSRIAILTRTCCKKKNYQAKVWQKTKISFWMPKYPSFTEKHKTYWAFMLFQNNHFSIFLISFLCLYSITFFNNFSYYLWVSLLVKSLVFKLTLECSLFYLFKLYFTFLCCINYH